MASKQPFGGNYVLLKLEEVSVVDLVRLLFSSKLHNRRFIECPDELEYREFERRWILFISVVVQKALLTFRKPLSQIGSVVEMWLNLLSSNGGFIRLLFNILRGKMVRLPNRSSAEFTSVVGSLDPRVELDKSIKHEDTKYRGSLSVMASKLSYENKKFTEAAVTDHWDMDFLGFYSFWNEYEELPSTPAIIFQDSKSKPNLIVVAFRGTEPFDADQWRTDVDISSYEIPNVGNIHAGFMKALGLQRKGGWPKEIGETSEAQHEFAYYTIRKKLKEALLVNEKAKFILTGHSLGAALAILFVAVLALHEEAWLLDKLEGVYTFGQPRVGDEQFGEFMKDKLRKYDVRYMRYVYNNDLVPRIPYDDKTLLFKHFGPCIFFNSLYQGQVLEEEPNKNYFSLLWAIPKRLIAAWELVRSFIIPFIGGEDYNEVWLMKLMRLVGLIVPGLTEHVPLDYVNLTRLGTLPASLKLQNPQDSKAD